MNTQADFISKTLKGWVTSLRRDPFAPTIDDLPAEVVWLFIEDYTLAYHPEFAGLSGENLLDALLSVLDQDSEFSAGGNMPNPEQLKALIAAMEEAERAADRALEQEKRNLALDRLRQFMERYNKDLVERMARKLEEQGVPSESAGRLAEQVTLRVYGDLQHIEQKDAGRELPLRYVERAKEVFEEIRSQGGSLGAATPEMVSTGVGEVASSLGNSLLYQVVSTGREIGKIEEGLPDVASVATVAFLLRKEIPEGEAGLFDVPAAAVYIAERMSYEDLPNMTEGEGRRIVQEALTAAATPVGVAGPVVGREGMERLSEGIYEALLSTGSSGRLDRLATIAAVSDGVVDDVLLEEVLGSVAGARGFLRDPMTFLAARKGAGTVDSELSGVLKDGRSLEAAKLLAAFGKAAERRLQEQESRIEEEIKRKNQRETSAEKRRDPESDQRVVWLRTVREQIASFREKYPRLAEKIENDERKNDKGRPNSYRSLKRLLDSPEFKKIAKQKASDSLNRYLGTKTRRYLLRTKEGRFVVRKTNLLRNFKARSLVRLGRTTLGQWAKRTLATFRQRLILGGKGRVFSIGKGFLKGFSNASGKLFGRAGFSALKFLRGAGGLTSLAGKAFALGAKAVAGAGAAFSAAASAAAAAAAAAAPFIIAAILILALFVLLVLVISHVTGSGSAQLGSKYIHLAKSVVVDSLSGTTFGNNIIDNKETATYTIEFSVDKNLTNVVIADVTTVTGKNGTLELSKRVYDKTTDPSLASVLRGQRLTKTYTILLSDQRLKDSYVTNVVTVESAEGEQKVQTVVLSIGDPPKAALSEFAKGLIDLMVSSYGTDLMTYRNLGSGGDSGGRLLGKSVGGRTVNQHVVTQLVSSADNNGALQCVGFVLAVAIGVGQPINPLGNAADFFGKSGGGWVWHGHSEIRNIKPGDVFVSKKGTYGHMGVVYTVNANGFSLAEAIGVDTSESPLGLIRYGQSFYAFAQAEGDGDYGYLAYGR